MDAVCGGGDAACEMHALSAALHSLHLYCAAVAAALICCCTPKQPHWCGKRWRWQDARGVASLGLAALWCCGAAAAALRPSNTVHLVASAMAPLAWVAATALHIALWTRRSAAPILYLAIYWFLAATSSATILWQHITTEPLPTHIEIYIQAASMLLALGISMVDCICFYDEVTKRTNQRQKPSTEINISYKHHDTHFYSKISFFWLNSLLRKGYESPLEHDDLGDLPEREQSRIYYNKFRRIYKDQQDSNGKKSVSIWQCYTKLVWPSFYLAGVMKLLSDLIGVVPPLGLAIVIQFLEDPAQSVRPSSHVTLQEFFSNGYVMLFLITLALISQAFLSQNSTHLVTVEGTRLKTALQAMVYDKCMGLAPWSSPEKEVDEDSPLLHSDSAANTQSGLLTNLVSQDTYNIMSCVWICHYMWAIPLKVGVILYLLYTKLGVSAIIGTAASVFFLTPLQFYIGKRLSDNSKEISKCTDHRVSKMTEILQGINVIKLYVWEDLFNEKILNLREVELKLLNKDSIYWSFLTFTTQVSTILVTVITFTVYYFMEDSTGLTAVNVFAGLALFNQLTIPLLILPVTVMMVIQAMVSTKRIKDFLELPESYNIKEDNLEVSEQQKCADTFNNAFVDAVPEDTSIWDEQSKEAETELADHFSDDDSALSSLNQEYLVKLRNAVFSWGTKNDALLEVDELDIPAGKLIMVVGSTGSGKTSLLSALLGEMFLEKGDVVSNSHTTTWYAGQPPWLLEGTVRDNIVMDSVWCQQRYARVLRATGLRPDLQLMPDGDATYLGSHGAPLSGGQRVRVCVARALYSNARLLALDEPLGALDAALARHVVARALVPCARVGRTVLVATNRLELLHYADLIIVMEEGRVSGFGRAGGGGGGVLARWAQLAADARAAAARGGAGPPGGTARERSRLVRALSNARFQMRPTDDAAVGINEATGAHLLAEVATVSGGSWRRGSLRTRPKLSRQLSSPPPSMQNYKWRREVRRAVSADASNAALQREASLLRRLLRPRTHRTLARWTPRTLRRLINSDVEATTDNNRANGEDTTLDTTYASLASNGTENAPAITNEATPLNKDDVEQEPVISECAVWREYARACGWWGAAYCAAAVTAQALAVAADVWLTYTTARNAKHSLTQDEMWNSVCVYAFWCAVGACAMGCAGLGCAGAGAAARRALHDRVLHATLHAPLQRRTQPGTQLHRFSSDILVIDKKLPTAVSRWVQLVLICSAAVLVNVVAAPWSLLALLPALALYLILQSIYLCNARELQRVEARSAASVVSLCAETNAGAATVRAGRLQPRMRTEYLRRLDANHNALLLLNAANRWLGLSMDLVGAATVCVSIGVALATNTGGAVAGLAGAYSLLVPAYLAHLAKGRSDLHLQLAAVERVLIDAAAPQEDYRDDCPIPSGWQRNGKIEFENVSVQHEPGMPATLNNVNITVAAGEKIAICGRSGSGKSTLILTCAGATTVRSGRLIIDDADALKVPLRTLRHRIVVLPQEPVMFSGTLRENLDPLAVHTDEEIWISLRAVGLYEFVTAQSAGLECVVGRSRSGWSGGRAARACAARAALHARLASALLLDEPGAALDAPAERSLLAALRATAPNTTLITVAHRISSVRGYDRAVVLEEGRVAEQGPVDALLAQPTSRLARMLAAAATHHHHT